jgi:lysophospholipase L1-like esterase
MTDTRENEPVIEKSRLSTAACWAGAGGIVLAHFLGQAWSWRYDGPYPLTLYGALALAYVLLACLFLWTSFRLSQTRAQKASKFLLSLFPFMLLVGFSDGCLYFRGFDTSGPGGKLCFTHCNWYATFVSNNSSGYWERDLIPFLPQNRRSNQCIIAVIGDSFVWGQGARGAEYRFTNLLEKRLRDALPEVPITVLNFGVGGADTRREIKTFTTDCVSLLPDLVIICYLPNDITVSTEDVEYIDFTLLEKVMLRMSPTMNYLYWRSVAPKRYEAFGREYIARLINAYKDEQAFGEHAADICRYVDAVRKIGSQPVFVILPCPFMWQHVDRSVRNSIYGRIAQVARARGTPLLELQFLEDTVPKKVFELSNMDAHPSERGHSAIADELARFLEQAPFFQDIVARKHVMRSDSKY